MDFGAFFSVNTVKRFWAPLALTFIVVSVFAGGTMLSAYRAIRGIPVVGGALPVK